MPDRAWPVRRLGDLATWMSGGTPSTHNADYWGGDIPWISAASLRDFNIDDSDRRLTVLGAAHGTRLAPAGSTIFVVRGMSLKSEFRVGIAQRTVAFGQDCKALVPAEGIDPRYLAWAIKASTPKILTMVDEAGHGTGRLETRLIANHQVGVPPLAEQRRMVEILDSVDEQSSTAKMCLSKLVRQLDGATLSLGGDARWPDVRLGDVLDGARGSRIQTGPFGSQLHAHDYVVDGTPVVMPQDILAGKISTTQIATVGQGKIAELSRHILCEGDVVLSRRGDLGRCSLITVRETGWLCGTGCLLVRTGNVSLTPGWLALVYRGWHCQMQIAARAVGSTMPNLNTSILESLVFPLPSVDDQYRALAMINQYRDACARSEAVIAKYVALKQALMDDLLTGRVRVPVGAEG
ncbi:MAG: restriction endonuclease subunit S [Pseudonocardiaceae bacterium]